MAHQHNQALTSMFGKIQDRRQIKNTENTQIK